jgi:hypothetical protein
LRWNRAGLAEPDVHDATTAIFDHSGAVILARLRHAERRRGLGRDKFDRRAGRLKQDFLGEVAFSSRFDKA